MRSHAEKSSKPASPTAATEPLFAKKREGGFFSPAAKMAAPSVQAKMRLSQPEDKLEREADKTADKVMRMQPPSSQPKEELQRQPDDRLQKQATPDERVARKEGNGEERISRALAQEDKERISRAPAEEAKLQRVEDERVSRKNGDGAASVPSSVESAVGSSAHGGEPLPGHVLSYMEPRFGADFGGVRTHNDESAAKLNDRLHARAFTYRNHLFFARDQYQPGTSEGNRLLAHELAHTVQQAQAPLSEGPAAIRKAAAPPAKDPSAKEAVTSSEAVDLAGSSAFNPSQKVQDEIEAQGHKGLEVRVLVRGVTGEGKVKTRTARDKKHHSIGKGTMPLLNPWAEQLGGVHVNFSIRDGQISDGYASLKPGGANTNDWLKALQKNAALLGGLGLKIENLPKPVNKFEDGKLTLGVDKLKVEIGGFLDASFNILVENNNKPKIEATSDINIKGLVKGQLKLDNAKEKLAGELSLAIEYKSFSGSALVKYNADGSVDVGGKAAYNADRLSGEISFVSTDLESANKLAKDAIAAAGGKENVQDAGPPGPVPPPKEGKKQRALAATGKLAFNLTTWFAGTVFVVVDGKGAVTVIGKIAPPAEIELFKQRDWDVELVKLEAKAYYGIPVVGDLNLFANISLHAISKLGPAKIYNIEVLGTYSTDPEIQKFIQISGSINISAYGGLRLRAEGGAGVEIASHDLKFGIGLNADVGVMAYADARPTIGYRDPGVFYISGTLDIVAQPVLGLGGDFFISLETPWWSPLSDHRWTWPLFSKEWPLGDPIGISALVKEYELGSKKVPEIELKKPEFDAGKMMTKMVDDDLPNKSGGKGAGQGTFKDDGTVPKPTVPPKKPEPKKADAKPAKKGAQPKGGKSATPTPNASKEQSIGKTFQNASKPLAALKGKAPFTRPVLNHELTQIKAQVSGIDFEVQLKGEKWLVTPKAGGKKGKGIEFAAKDVKKEDTAQAGVSSDLENRSKQGMEAAIAVVNKFADAEVGEEQLLPLLSEVKVHYQFVLLEIVPDGDIWDVQGAMSLKKTAKTKAKNPIKVYKDILTALGLPAINEKKAKKYRQQMRSAIVAKYKGSLTRLNKDVLVSDIIPAAQNRIRGDIFEEWLQVNQVIDKPSPIFVHDDLYKKRIADGIKGSSLVDAKVRQPGSGPSPTDVEQMQAYNTIINNKILSISKNVTYTGPFVQVIYIFNDKKIIPFWRSYLVANLKGNYSTA